MNRHWRQPLVTGTLEEESLDIHGVIRLHLTNSFGDCAPPSQLPRFKEPQTLEPDKNRPAKAVFVIYESNNAPPFKKTQMIVSSKKWIFLIKKLKISDA